jgi:AAA domain
VPEVKKLGASDYIRMMLYAYPGWRKTSFVATTPDAGFKTLLIRTPLDQIPKRALDSGMDEVVINNWEDMMGGDGVLDWLRYDKHGYEFVWWDNVSVDQDVLLDDVWAGTVAEKPHRAYKIGQTGEIEGLNLSPTSGLDRGEYGRNMERIQQFVRHIVGINSFHIGFTAHPIEDQHPTNDEGGSLLVPYIQGKGMTPKICGYCNIIAFNELREDEDPTYTRMHFRENSRFYAKDLYDAFPDGYMDNPTVPKLMEAVTGTANLTSRRGRRRGAAPTAQARPGRRKGARK